MAYQGPVRAFGESTFGTGTWDGYGTILSLGATWGNQGWGEGAWGDNYNVSVQGTGAIGTVVIAVSENIIPVGVEGTGCLLYTSPSPRD